MRSHGPATSNSATRIYLSFYRAEEYEKAANTQLALYNRLKTLYRSVESGEDTAAAEAELSTIDGEFYACTISKQVFLSGWYAHYKAFAETQIGWLDQELSFTWKDKWPVSARISIAVVVIAIIAGVAWSIAHTTFCK